MSAFQRAIVRDRERLNFLLPDLIVAQIPRETDERRTKRETGGVVHCFISVLYQQRSLQNGKRIQIGSLSNRSRVIYFPIKFSFLPAFARRTKHRNSTAAKYEASTFS